MITHKTLLLWQNNSNPAGYQISFEIFPQKNFKKRVNIECIVDTGFNYELALTPDMFQRMVRKCDAEQGQEPIETVVGRAFIDGKPILPWFSEIYVCLSGLAAPSKFKVSSWYGLKENMVGLGFLLKKLDNGEHLFDRWEGNEHEFLLRSIILNSCYKHNMDCSISKNGRAR